MKLLFLVALGALASAQSSTNAPFAYVDRRCGEDLGNLWLEVVAVVDNSRGMTNDGLTSVAANIAGVFSDGTRIGTQYNEPRTTRVGLVTYNAVANIDADLNQFQSIDDLYDGVFGDLSKVSNSDESYLANGLAAAEQLLEQGSQSSNRSHYQKVVIVYASTYKVSGSTSPLPVADRLKATGAIIITVAYDQDGDGSLLADLSKIATPHYSFSNTDVAGNLLGEYRSIFADVYSHRYGVCIQAVGLSTVWRAGRLACRNRWPNAYLVNEYDVNKHNYVLSIAQNTTGFFQPFTYHIGLQLSGGKWTWEQPASQSAAVQQQNYSPWNPGYPVSSSSLSAVLSQQSSSAVATGWQNINPMTTSANYVCEVASCDTDNYCAKVDDTEAVKAENN